MRRFLACQVARDESRRIVSIDKAVRLHARQIREVASRSAGDEQFCLIRIALSLEHCVSKTDTPERFSYIKDIKKAFDLGGPSCAAFLNVLLESPGQLVAYADLRESLNCTQGSLKVFASRVSKALADADVPRAIKNVRNSGYVLRADAVPTILSRLNRAGAAYRPHAEEPRDEA